MDWLLAQDRALLLLINGAHNSLADDFMSIVSEKWAWLPLYAVLLVLLYKLLGWRETGVAILALVVVIIVSDQTASTILKPLVERPRPCHVVDLKAVLHVVDGKCGGPYGFASSHAANFFGLATLVGWLLRKRYFWLSCMLFALAALVAYSRVYLGVHYPGDVVGGGLVGVLAGILGIFLFKIVQKRLNFPQSERK